MHDLPQAALTQERSVKMGYRKGRWPGIGVGAERKTARASGRRTYDPPPVDRNAEAGPSGCRLHRIARHGGSNAEGDRNLMRGATASRPPVLRFAGTIESGAATPWSGPAIRGIRKLESSKGRWSEVEPSQAAAEQPAKNEHTQASGRLGSESRQEIEIAGAA